MIHQPSYNIFDRWIEEGLTEVLEDEGIGAIVFCPLAQGMLTDKYLKDVPSDSRAAKEHGFLSESVVHAHIDKVRALNEIAQARGQSLAQMAITWVLRQQSVTSALIGASRPQQILDNLAALSAAPLTVEELQGIDAICLRED